MHERIALLLIVSNRIDRTLRGYYDLRQNFAT